MLPATVEDFLELVKKSGVLEQRRLDAYVESARRAATLPKEPAPLADAMIRDGLLTTFQARALLRGKWRGFRIGLLYELGILLCRLAPRAEEEPLDAATID